MAQIYTQQDIDKWTKHFDDSITSPTGNFKKINDSNTNGKFKQISNSSDHHDGNNITLGKVEPYIKTISVAQLGENIAMSQYKATQKRSEK